MLRLKSYQVYIFQNINNVILKNNFSAGHTEFQSFKYSDVPHQYHNNYSFKKTCFVWFSGCGKINTLYEEPLQIGHRPRVEQIMQILDKYKIRTF